MRKGWVVVGVLQVALFAGRVGIAKGVEIEWDTFGRKDGTPRIHR